MPTKRKSGSAGPTVERYLAAQPPATRAVLVKVRAAIRQALPSAEERISYQIPAYELDGRMVLSFAGWKSHWSLYPVTDSIREALGDALSGYEYGRGTVRFPLEGRVPVALVARIARLRARELSAKPKRATRRKRPS